MNLSNASGTTIVDGQGVGTILDDDGPALQITDVKKLEGSSGINAYRFIVTLSVPSSTPVTVEYATADGTATAGSDYTATSGTFTFPPTQTRGAITVNVLGDAVREPDETFTVNLSNASGADIRNGQGTGTIVNDD